MKNILPLMNQWKLTDLTVKNILFTDESVKMQILDSISENLTDSDLECNFVLYIYDVDFMQKTCVTMF